VCEALRFQFFVLDSTRGLRRVSSERGKSFQFFVLDSMLGTLMVLIYQLYYRFQFFVLDSLPKPLRNRMAIVEVSFNSLYWIQLNHRHT